MLIITHNICPTRLMFRRRDLHSAGISYETLFLLIRFRASVRGFTVVGVICGMMAGGCYSRVGGINHVRAFRQKADVCAID